MKNVIISIIFTIVCIGCSNNGILAIEGYEHATVICGEALIVNDGHYNDTKVAELIKLAKEECK